MDLAEPLGGILARGKDSLPKLGAAGGAGATLAKAGATSAGAGAGGTEA